METTQSVNRTAYAYAQFVDGVRMPSCWPFPPHAVPPPLALLLEDCLGEEEGVREHDGAVDDGDGAHGQPGVTLRPSHERVVVPGRREENILQRYKNGLIAKNFFLLSLNRSAWLFLSPA